MTVIEAVAETPSARPLDTPPCDARLRPHPVLDLGSHPAYCKQVNLVNEVKDVPHPTVAEVRRMGLDPDKIEHFKPPRK